MKNFSKYKKIIDFMDNEINKMTWLDARHYLINVVQTHCQDGSLRLEFGGNKMNKENVISILRNRFPGFHDETYIRAYTELMTLKYDHIWDFLKTGLNKDWIKVKFLKADGSEREMICTQNFEVFRHDPEFSYVDKEIKPKKSDFNPNIFTVFEKNVGWRSFKYDSVKEIICENITLYVNRS